MKAEGDLGVRLRRQSDVAGAGNRQPRRRRIHLSTQLLAAQRQRAGDLADALVRDCEVVDAEPDVVARLIERAAPAGGELGDAGQGRAAGREECEVIDWNPPAIGVEGIGRIPADECCAGHGSGILRERQIVEPDAGAVEAHRRAHLLERLLVRDAVVNRHRAEADRTFVPAGQMKLPRDQAGHRIVVDAERVAQAVDVAAGQPHPRIDLLAAIIPRVAQSESSIRADL